MKWKTKKYNKCTKCTTPCSHRGTAAGWRMKTKAEMTPKEREMWPLRKVEFLLKHFNEFFPKHWTVGKALAADESMVRTRRCATPRLAPKWLSGCLILL